MICTSFCIECTFTVLIIPAELKEKDKADDDELETLDKFILEDNKVSSVTFPTYAPPNVKDDMVSRSRSNARISKLFIPYNFSKY